MNDFSWVCFEKGLWPDVILRSFFNLPLLLEFSRLATETRSLSRAEFASSLGSGVRADPLLRLSFSKYPRSHDDFQAQMGR